MYLPFHDCDVLCVMYVLIGEMQLINWVTLTLSTKHINK